MHLTLLKVIGQGFPYNWIAKQELSYSAKNQIYISVENIFLSMTQNTTIFFGESLVKAAVASM